MSKDYKENKFDKELDKLKDSKKSSRYGNKNKFRNKDGIPSKNDVWFYAPSEQIAKDVASIPFNYLNGTKFPISGTVTRSKDGTAISYPIGNDTANASVMRLDYVPSIGVANSATEGVNMAAAQLYSYVRHANSGARNYEAPDLFMYVLAMRDIYTQFFELKRAYGAVNLFHYYNHSVPKTLVHALGIDYDDLRANMAQYRYRLNQVARKINSFAVPKYFRVFDRSAYISSTVFADSTSIRGQFYVMCTSGYYTWSGTTSTTGTELLFQTHAIMSTFGDRLAVIENQLDAMFYDQDALTMSGDILKAFSEGELYIIQETDSNYVITPAYDENMLGQIENSHTLFIDNISLHSENIIDSVNFNITQMDQIIEFNPIVYTRMDAMEIFNTAVSVNRLAFNSHKDNPDYKDVLEWSRLQTVAAYTTGTFDNMAFRVATSGLEILLNYHLYRNNVDGSIIEHIINSSITQKVNVGGFINAEPTLSVVDSLLGQFDWKPIIYYFRFQETSSGTIIPVSLLSVADFKVATTIDFGTVANMNECAIYSAFYAKDLYSKS